MKKIINLCLLAILSVNPTYIFADDSGAVLNAGTTITSDASNSNAATSADITPQQVKSTGDPTLDFFVALTQCVPGTYNEKNVITEESGETWLKQRIITMDSGICYTQLSTPDNRILYCEFPFASLSGINEQHFMHGVLINSATDPSADSIHADQVWSDLKSNYCSFTGS